MVVLCKPPSHVKQAHLDVCSKDKLALVVPTSVTPWVEVGKCFRLKVFLTIFGSDEVSERFPTLRHGVSWVLLASYVRFILTKDEGEAVKVA